MRGRFMKRVQQDVHQLYGTDNGMAFKLRRVRSADMVSAGIAEMVGVADAMAALTDVQSEQAADAALTDEAREKRAAIEARKAEAQMEALRKAILKSPERIRDFAQRIDAYVCAAVVEAGEWEGGEDRILSPSEVQYLEPIRFVMSEADADPESGRLWVVDLPEGVRQAVCGAAQALTSARAAVRPFPDAARVASDVA